jgi:hypothetical protein
MDALDLSWTQRIALFGTSFGFGVLCLMLSCMLWFSAVTGSAYKLVLLVSMGHVLILTSTIFLAGCRAQLTNMLQENRRKYSIAYLTSLLIGAFLAIEFPYAIVMIPMLIVQGITAGFYVFSYLPSWATVKQARSMLPI